MLSTNFLECRLRSLWFDDVDCVACFDGVEVDVVWLAFLLLVVLHCVVQANNVHSSRALV